MAITNPVDPFTNLVVQASAGTGKTWTLTNRLVGLLIAGAAPGSILAITFTRQAAAEMQQRVGQRLLDLALCPSRQLDPLLSDFGIVPNDEARNTARRLYEGLLGALFPFRIMTFHAFSQELLRRFSLEAGVPPGFELCEQTGELEGAAWDALERELTREPGQPLAHTMDVLLRAVGRLPAVRTGLLAFLAHRGDWWSYTEDQLDPLSYAVDRLRRELQISTDSPAHDLLADGAARSDFARYAELLRRHPNPTNSGIVTKIEDALATRDRPDAAFGLLRAAFLTQDRLPRQLRTGAALTKRLGSADAANLERLHTELARRVQATEQARQRHNTLALSRAWYTCGTRLLEHYQRLKQEQGLLDFADLEWLAYRLLNTEGHAEWVQYKLDQRIDHLLVDEFQDTNPTQWRLLQPLMAELAAGDPTRRRGIFLVGDAKQSIYRFRRAEPRLFDTARDWLVQSAGAAVVTQDISWRSSAAVLRFVDMLFESSGDAAPYRLDDYRPHGVRHAALWGRAELLPLIRRERNATPLAAFRNPLTAPRILEEDQRHYREGQQVAARIAELVGHPLGADGRPLAYGDIVILMRDRVHASDYELALRHAGIPYAGADRGNLTNCLEVRDVIHLLTFLTVPDDNLALASALRSPLFAAGDDDLQQLAHEAGDDEAWYDRLVAIQAPAGGALARAQRLLPRWREAVDRVPVHDLLDRIYCEGDVLARYESAAPAHLKDRVTNQLNRLLALALEADSGRFPSLARFIERLPALTADDYETGPNTGTGDRVRLMTIHAAKGLEAPVVFLLNAAQPPTARERGPRALIEWPADAPRPQVFHFIGGRDDIDDVSAQILSRIDLGDRREESNLLYVALTRARQVLYVSGCEPGRANGDPGSRRGWYGFIETRLAAMRTQNASSPGWSVTEIRDKNGATFNLCGRLEHGIPPPPAGAPPVPDAPLIVDPALTRPLPPLAPGTAPTQPSRHTLAADADTPDRTTTADTAARRGAVIHRALEQLSAAERAHTAAIRAQLWREWTGQLGADEFDAYWTEAQDVIEHPEFRRFFDAGAYQRARNEMPILYASGDQTVYGFIDRLVWHGNEILLLDYKTHRITRAEAVASAARFEPQLRLYAEGVRRLWPDKIVRGFVVFTACREAIEISV